MFVFIFALFMVFSLFTTHEMKRFITHQMYEQVFASREKLEQRCHIEEQEVLYKNITSKRGDTKPDLNEPKEPKETLPKNPDKETLYLLKLNLSCPPENSWFNLNSVFKDAEESKTFLTLLRLLYSEAPFYVPGCEEKILKTLIARQEDLSSFDTFEKVSTLTFDDPDVQHIFFQMLRGKEGFPSLLRYVHFKLNPDKKINFLFAPAELIQAIVGKKESQKILILRERLWQELLFQEKNQYEIPESEKWKRSTLNDYLKESFKTHMIQEGLNPDLHLRFVFNFGIPGKVVVLQDAKSEMQLIEKIK